eukprot:m.135818 g.135818  ORF g.135818 m.135818 type:complete len:89 (-) comp13984_c1_seq2:132-398(-)
MVTIVQCARNPARFFATRIYRACKGLGTDDQALMRIVTSRSEVDMQQIKELYPEIGGVSLAEQITSETRGYYKQLLLELVGEPLPDTE